MRGREKMKWAVEARIFSNGKIVSKVRPATEDDSNGCTETNSCAIWIDIFETEQEARRFCNGYRNG